MGDSPPFLIFECFSWENISPQLGEDFYAIKGLQNTFVCDGSLLQAAGIANSGLTLVALSYRLADVLQKLDAV